MGNGRGGPQTSRLYQCFVDALKRSLLFCIIYLFFLFRTYQFVLWYCHSKGKAYCIKLVIWKERNCCFYFILHSCKCILFQRFCLLLWIILWAVPYVQRSSSWWESVFEENVLVWSVPVDLRRLCSIACIIMSSLPCQPHQASSMSTRMSIWEKSRLSFQPER